MKQIQTTEEFRCEICGFEADKTEIRKILLRGLENNAA